MDTGRPDICVPLDIWREIQHFTAVRVIPTDSNKDIR